MPRPVIPQRRVWFGLAAVVLVIGAFGSFLGAREAARNDSERSRHAFLTSSADIASTLRLAILHEQDLAVSAAAFVIDNPTASPSQFQQWTNAVQAFQRYPEVNDIAEMILVPASDLSTFAAHATANPSPWLSVGAGFQVIPPGPRPYYCMISLLAFRSGGPATPAGLDVCAGTVGAALMRARDTGRGAYLPYGGSDDSTLGVGTPIYQGDVVPSTVQARRDAFIGWVGTGLRPGAILATALLGHPGTAVAFRYRSGSISTTIRAGHAAAGAQSTTIVLTDGWRVQVFSALPASDIAAYPGALGSLIGGVALSLLLGVLVYVLGTSRSRAVLMVRARTDELRHQALHDPLTGLPNRSLILDRMDQMLERARRHRTRVAVLFIDLDNFKDINDTLGHFAGDQVLGVVAGRLTEVVRKGDTVGRLGGDEFVVLVEGASLTAGAEMVAFRVLDIFTAPIEIPDSDTPLMLHASVGIAEGDRATPQDLLRDADIALYKAKATGKQRAVVFCPSMREDVDDHRHLEVDLHDALEADQFFLVYQPTVDLASGTLTGVEALLRWRHPLRGIVQPDQFIPALESTGLIVPVGAWVLREACRQGALWTEQGHRFTMSANVSARQLELDRIVDDVDAALAGSGFDPNTLILELTETALMRDVQATAARLDMLKTLGVRIAIDDFGMGYSSLAYLRQFPIDVLKIDRSFVTGIVDSPQSAAIVHTLVQLGKVLGLAIIAEGIETDEQRVRLQSEGVDMGQGFLFARPLDVEAMSHFLGHPTDIPGVSVGLR